MGPDPKGYDEPETLRCSNPQICPTRADAKQLLRPVADAAYGCPNFIKRFCLMRTFILGLLAFISFANVTLAQTPYGSCPLRAQVYQERYESSGRSSDLVCFQKALERELTSSRGFLCPNSSQSYQTAYERYGRSNDLVCFQQALERELR